MSMVFCRGCGKEIHDSALACPQCGAPQKTVAALGLNNIVPGKQFHITLIVAASIGILLLYTTMSFALIGAATGLSFGLSVRLFFTHKKNNFLGTKKLDWVLLIVLAIIAFILMLAQSYAIQALVLIVLAVRSLMMYFTIYGNDVVRVSDKGN